MSPPAAEGAASGLHRVVQKLGGVAPDGHQPGRHACVCHLLDGVQAAAQDIGSSLKQLLTSPSVSVCAASRTTHGGRTLPRPTRCRRSS